MYDIFSYVHLFDYIMPKGNKMEQVIQTCAAQNSCKNKKNRRTKSMVIQICIPTFLSYTTSTSTACNNSISPGIVRKSIKVFPYFENLILILMYLGNLYVFKHITAICIIVTFIYWVIIFVQFYHNYDENKRKP